MSAAKHDKVLLMSDSANELLALSELEKELGFFPVLLEWEKWIDEESGHTLGKMVPVVICILDAQFSSVIRVPHPDGENLCYMLHLHGVHEDHVDQGITWHGIGIGTYNDPEIAFTRPNFYSKRPYFPFNASGQKYAH